MRFIVLWVLVLDGPLITVFPVHTIRYGDLTLQNILRTLFFKGDNWHKRTQYPYIDD